MPGNAHTVISGTTKMFAPDGTLEATVASPRVTLDASGDVVTEERLSPAGAVVLRRQFAGGRVVEEEHFAADGALDERITYHYDASGRLGEEAMTLGDGTPHGKWICHHDDRRRLVKRDFAKPDGTIGATETYTYAPDGKTATMVRARVGQWKYRYDDHGCVLSQEGGPASGDAMDQLAIDYAYDARHRLVREVARGPGGRMQRELHIAY